MLPRCSCRTGAPLVRPLSLWERDEWPKARSGEGVAPQRYTTPSVWKHLGPKRPRHRSTTRNPTALHARSLHTSHGRPNPASYAREHVRIGGTTMPKVLGIDL